MCTILVVCPHSLRREGFFTGELVVDRGDGENACGRVRWGVSESQSSNTLTSCSSEFGATTHLLARKDAKIENG